MRNARVVESRAEQGYIDSVLCIKLVTELMRQMKDLYPSQGFYDSTIVCENDVAAHRAVMVELKIAKDHLKEIQFNLFAQMPTALRDEISRDIQQKTEQAFERIKLD